MYSVLRYSEMVADDVRTDAYVQALERSVKPGDVVVEIGSGTGFFALLAARAGAKRVHAIEPSPSVWLLKELARANGLSDRIVIHPSTSQEVTLDEKADVVISDLRGSTPLFEGHLAALADAKARFVAPGGRFIPDRDRLFVALTEAPALWSRIEKSWRAFEARAVTADPIRASVVNTLHVDGSEPITANDLVSKGACWATIRYGEPPSPMIEGTVDLHVERDGVARGLALWFEATLCDGVTFDNAPGRAMVYSRLFLPFARELTLRTGDPVTVTVRADPTGERWAWDVHGAGVELRQSTFLGVPAAPIDLLRTASTSVPTLSQRGEHARAVLDAIDGRKTIRELRKLAPEDEVKDLVQRYSR